MKYLILFFWFYAISVWAITPVSSLKINNYYDDNVIRLSDKLLNEFASGEYSEKFKIKTSDDIITSIDLEIGLKNKFHRKHTQIFKLKFLYNNYYSNALKNNFGISTYYKQFISKKINYTIEYSYFPQLYLRQYKSEFDNGDTYHDFTYSKNSYLFKASYKILQKTTLTGEINYSQLYYNEYFTEYDTNDLSYKEGIKISPTTFMNISTYYTFKKASQINRNGLNIVKNPSYNANRYNLNISFFTTSKLSDVTSVNYEEKFFLSNNEADTYHIGRNDYKISLKNALTYSLSKKIKFSIFYRYEKRDTKSPYKVVKDDKTYEFQQIGAGVSINNLF